MRLKVKANLVFLLHAIVILILLVGWRFESLSVIYPATLIGTLFFELFLGYCPLSKFEFGFRKQIDPSLDYNHSFFGFYGHKFFERHISPKLIRVLSLVFLIVSLFAYTYAHF